jgi:ABC-type phosphate transport system permease subunit
MVEREQTGIEVKLEFIIKELDEIKLKLEKNYVTAEEFKPVKTIVYGMVALILTSVVVALIALVVKK